MNRHKRVVRRTAKKRLTPSGSYRFYDTRGKRISKASYYSRLKRYHKRIEEQKKPRAAIRQVKEHKRIKPRRVEERKRKRSVVAKSSYEGKYTRGFNYTKSVSIWIDEYQDNLDPVIERVRVFYLDCRRRFKLLRFCYFNFKAKIFLESGATEIFHINTRVSFPSQYDDSAFFFSQVGQAFEQFVIMLEDATHSGEWEDLAEKIKLLHFSLHSREDKSFKKVSRKGKNKRPR